MKYTINKNDAKIKEDMLMWRKDETSADEALYEESALTITYPSKVVVREGDTVVFSRNYNGSVYLTTEVEVLEVLGSESCKISIPERGNLTVVDSIDNGDGYTIVVLSGVSGILPDDLKETPEISMVLTDGNGNTYDCGNVSIVGKESGVLANLDEMSDYMRTRINLTRVAIQTKVDIPVDIRGFQVSFSKNPFFYIKESNVILWDNTTISHRNSHINLRTVIGTCEETGLQHEDLVYNGLIQTTLNSVVPPFLDMEKVQFKPYFSYWEAERLIFNLHFRTREKDADGNYTIDWAINENGLWGRNNSSAISMSGDPIGDLNFTADDVYYQKEKLQRSFLRISFYDSPLPLNQQLLGYSTVFFDTGEMYNTYAKNMKGDNKEAALSSVTATFTITGNQDLTKSSEGFYIYLFPSEIGETGMRRIWMRVDFNHAGYGRTIPFIRPYTISTGIAGSIDAKDFFNYQYIPVDVTYLKDKGYYGYTIPDSVMRTDKLLKTGCNVDTSTQSLIFTLVETKLA